jgi:putative FmdB family regulatory protein
MPTYDYKCPNCQKVIEIKHSMIDQPNPACIDCMLPLQRVFKIAGVSFKGSGWGSSR